MITQNAIILENKQIADEVYEMTLAGHFEALPGQFVNIKLNNERLLLRRPISIYDANSDMVKIIYKTVGEGTTILSQMKKNDMLDVLGPVGSGFPIYKNKNVLIVGGGIGVPPLHYLAKCLNECNITFVLGFRNSAQVILEHELEQFGKVIVTTDDGSYGFKGNVLEAIEHYRIDFDVVYACGPTKMLEFLDKKYQGVREGYISFEERMACGMGICYGCVCKPKKIENGMLRVCKEGPVFPLGVIDYE